jgi:hypothetical protein
MVTFCITFHVCPPLQYTRTARRSPARTLPNSPFAVACLPEYFMYCNYLKRLGTRQSIVENVLLVTDTAFDNAIFGMSVHRHSLVSELHFCVSKLKFIVRYSSSLIRKLQTCLFCQCRARAAIGSHGKAACEGGYSV